MAKQPKWTEEEINILKENYKSFVDESIMKFLPKRNRISIFLKASRLKLTRKEGRFFSALEKEFILANYKSYTLNQLSDLIYQKFNKKRCNNQISTILKKEHIIKQKNLKYIKKIETGKSNLITLPLEEIKRLYNQNFSCAKIGRKFNCSDDVIRYRLKANNIPLKNRFDYPSHWKGKTNEITKERNLTNNPAKFPEVRKLKSEQMKKYYEKNPEKHPNYILRQKGHITQPERKFKDILESLGLQEGICYVYSQYIKTEYSWRFPDFRLTFKNIIFEIDGEYFHTNKIEESIRNSELRKLGYKVIHFSSQEVNRNMSLVLNKVIEVI